MNTSIRNEWEKLISSGIIPVIEYQTGENDWLVVYVQLSDDNECFFSFHSIKTLCAMFISPVMLVYFLTFITGIQLMKK